MTTKVVANRARTIARSNITKNINKLKPLLSLRGDEARRKREKVKELWDSLNTDRDIFKKAHELIYEATLEETSDAALDGALLVLDKYHDEVDDKFEEIKSCYQKFDSSLIAYDKRKQFESGLVNYVDEIKFIKNIHGKIQNGDLGKDAIMGLPIEENCDQLEQLFTNLRQILGDLKTLADVTGDKDVNTDSEEILNDHGSVRAMILEIRGLKKSSVAKSTLASGPIYNMAPVIPSPGPPSSIDLMDWDPSP